MTQSLTSVIGAFVSPLSEPAPVEASLTEIEATLDRCMLFAANVAIETTTQTHALKQHPDWFWRFEDVMPVTATPEELLELLVSAPTDYARGMIAGICGARIEMAAISGRL